MRYIKDPNLPVGPVSLGIVDGRISGAAENKLKSMGIEILKISPHPQLYDAVCGHPDMLFHHVGDNIIVYAPGADPQAVRGLAGYGFRMIEGESPIEPSYPKDIAYNVARVGNWYFHNLKYTDIRIKELMDQLGVEPIHVGQGYAKCSVLPVDGNSMVTSDVGIARAAKKNGLDVLLLDCGDSINLPGLDHGFIGGACGMVSDSACAINGSVKTLKDFTRLLSFFSERGISFIEISKNRITDIGSILPLMISDHGN